MSVVSVVLHVKLDLLVCVSGVQSRSTAVPVTSVWPTSTITVAGSTTVSGAETTSENTRYYGVVLLVLSRSIVQRRTVYSAVPFPGPAGCSSTV